MSPEVIQAIISVVGFLGSIGGGTYMAGRKSQVQDDHEKRITALEVLPAQISSIEASMSVMSHDLAEIKGMFRLTLKESP